MCLHSVLIFGLRARFRLSETCTITRYQGGTCSLVPRPPPQLSSLAVALFILQATIAAVEAQERDQGTCRTRSSLRYQGGTCRTRSHTLTQQCDDVMLSEIVQFRVLQPLSSAFCVVFRWQFVALKLNVLICCCIRQHAVFSAWTVSSSISRDFSNFLTMQSCSTLRTSVPSISPIEPR